MAPKPGPGMDQLEALLARDYENNARRSLRRARAAFRHVRDLLAGLDPDRAYAATQQYAVLRRAQGAQPATIRYEIAILGRALTLALREGLIAHRAELARPRVDNARRGFVDERGLRRLLRELPDPIADAALFAYVTGWRREEIFALTWDRVEPRTWIARLDGSKNGERRAYPAGEHPELRRMFERRHQARIGPYVFHRQGLRVAAFSRSWESACRRAGLGPTLFHDLRRSAVRNYERAGVPRSVAMQLTGHKTESIYRRYAITNEKDLARGVRLVAAESRRQGSR